MQLITGLLFEDPRSLWIALGIAEIVVLVFWSRRRDRATLYALLILPAAAVVLGLLDWAVETDHEAVHRSVRMIGRAARSRDVEAFIERVSPGYTNGPYRKEDLAALVRYGLPQVDVRTPLSAQVTIEGERAQVRHVYRIDSRPGASFNLHQAVRWDAAFGEDPDGEWRLRSVMATAPFPRARYPEGFLPGRR